MTLFLGAVLKNQPRVQRRAAGRRGRDHLRRLLLSGRQPSAIGIDTYPDPISELRYPCTTSL